MYFFLTNFYRDHWNKEEVIFLNIFLGGCSCRHVTLIYLSRLRQVFIIIIILLTFTAILSIDRVDLSLFDEVICDHLILIESSAWIILPFTNSQEFSHVDNLMGFIIVMIRSEVIGDHHHPKPTRSESE